MTEAAENSRKSSHTTRRAALTVAAAAPLGLAALAAGGTAGQAQTQPSQPQGPAVTPFFSFKLGDLKITSLLTASSASDNPQGTFGMNVSPEVFRAASAAAKIPFDKAQGFMSPVLVETPEGLVLFDTGLNAGQIVTALATVGVKPADVGTVVLTHLHGDHVGGLMDGDAPVFPAARYITGSAEFDYWKGQDYAPFKGKVAPLAAKFTLIADGESPVPGLKAQLAPGHTPGHMVWIAESGGRRAMIGGDLANHHVWSLANPSWQVRFDVDKDMAAASRTKVLGEVADSGMLYLGYHLPFPAVGLVERNGDGFRYIPATYQALIG